MIAAEQRGVSRKDLCAALGVDPARVDDPDAFIPGELIFRAWDEGARLTGDPDFGLHAGEATPMGTYDVLDYVVASSRTFGEALRAFARYYRLMTDHVELAFEAGPDVARIIQHVRVPASPGTRHAWECFLAAIIDRIRGGVGAAYAPKWVSFVHPEPADTSEHRRLFRAPLRFSQAHNEIAIERALAEAPIPSADPVLRSILARYADQLIVKIPPSDDIAQLARSSVLELLASDASLERVAQRLKMSRRTLQRRLTDAGTSFQDVVDAARRELSLRYLDDPKVSLSEIAFLLGFSQPNAFHRAFRRWTGKPPATYRNERATRPRQ